MNKKVGIAVSLVLALILTTVIVVKANHSNGQVTQKVKVAQATNYVPAGAALSAQNVKEVDVMKPDANGLAPFNEVIGKTTKVSLVQGQNVYSDALSESSALQPGFVSVYVPVQINSSAYALPGDKVDVYLINKNTKQAAKVLSAVPVLDSLDNQGREVEVGKTDLTKAASQQNLPAAVGIMVPTDSAAPIVAACDDKSVYLVKCAPEGR